VLGPALQGGQACSLFGQDFGGGFSSQDTVSSLHRIGSFRVWFCFSPPILSDEPRENHPTLFNYSRDISIARKYALLAVPNLSAFHDLLRPSKWFYPVNEGHLQSWDHAHFKNLVERHGNLEVIDWAFDTVIIPPISNIIVRFFGQKIAIRLETGLFKRIHPYASLSMIALASI
jgi:hypothetical protein